MLKELYMCYLYHKKNSLQIKIDNNFISSMSDKELSEGESTNTTVDFETPPKMTLANKKCSSALAKPSDIPRNLELERLMEKNFEQFKNQISEKMLLKVNNTHKKHIGGMSVVIILIVMFLIGFYVEYHKNLQSRVTELEHANKILKEDIRQLHQIFIKEKEYIEELAQSYENIKEEIFDIHMNELIKEQKSMHIFRKYSSEFTFNIEKGIKNFQDNFNERSDGNIKKKSEEEKMFYSENPFPKNSINFLQIKIVETLYGQISFGIMPESKKAQDCVYCDSSQMFYLYSYNGNIYNGKLLNLIHTSKKTKFEKIKNGDIITMFVDNKDKTVVWYVNSKYAGSESFKEVEGDVYPFIEMTSRGDQIRILQ